MTSAKYLFGPVPSRRFGLSLGVDLTPYKTCSFDCIFCQLGPTTCKTLARKSWVDVEVIQRELHLWLKAGGKADVITLSGSGEPTLHSDFGEILKTIHRMSDIPAVLLTNSTLMNQPEVRNAACEADIIKISLSAWDDDSLFRINHPHQDIRFNRIVEGLKALRAEYKRELWMEIFLLNGFNTAPEEIRRVSAIARKIAPDRIQLNTVARPASNKKAKAVSSAQLQDIAHCFIPQAELIPPFSRCGNIEQPVMIKKKDILNMLHRRPCTAAQIASTFGMHLNEVAKYTGQMLRSGHIRQIPRKEGSYFSAIPFNGESDDET